MGLFGGKPAPVYIEVPNAAPPSPREVREAHHGVILEGFERASRELEHAEGVKVRATEVAREAARTVDQAREVVDAQRRLLRRVAEGHI